MYLPPVVNGDIANAVTIQLLSEALSTQLFAFDETLGLVTLAASVEGDACPDVTEITLKFRLESKTLGQNDESITIPVKKPEPVKKEPEEEVVANTTIVVAEPVLDAWESLVKQKQTLDKWAQRVEKPKPLEVGQIEMSQTGEMKINFSKRILRPPFLVGDSVRRDL